MKKKPTILSPDDQEVLRKIGENIKLARKRRKMTVQYLAMNAGISRNTLYQIEQGYPGVAIGAWFNVLKVLGLLKEFEKIASEDPVGRAIQDYGPDGFH